MADFQINDADLAGVKGKVAVITGMLYTMVNLKSMLSVLT